MKGGKPGRGGGRALTFAEPVRMSASSEPSSTVQLGAAYPRSRFQISSSDPCTMMTLVSLGSDLAAGCALIIRHGVLGKLPASIRAQSSTM